MKNWILTFSVIAALSTCDRYENLHVNDGDTAAYTCTPPSIDTANLSFYCDTDTSGLSEVNDERLQDQWWYLYEMTGYGCDSLLELTRFLQNKQEYSSFLSRIKFYDNINNSVGIGGVIQGCSANYVLLSKNKLRLFLEDEFSGEPREACLSSDRGGTPEATKLEGSFHDNAVRSRCYKIRDNELYLFYEKDNDEFGYMRFVDEEYYKNNINI